MVSDAIVVGAGPAGAIAALRLARAGLRVRLLDRATFPRDKLCGDTLNPGALALIDRLERPPSRSRIGEASSLGERVRQRARPITGMLVTGPGGAAVSADYPDGAYGVALLRRDLDALLVDAAVAAGAQFEPAMNVRGPLLASDGTRVEGVRAAHHDQERLLRARIVIAADGRRSRLASTLGLTRFAPSPRRWAYGAYFASIDGLSARGEMHIRAGGYFGIAPLPNGLANVCVVRIPATRGEHGGRPSRASAAQVVTDAIAADPALRERFRSASRVSDVVVLGPLAVDARAAGCPGLLLAGDAAGFIDPMTGDGLRFALRGADLAAEAAMREIETGTPSHDALAAARARAFTAKWRVNRALRALVGSPRALQAAALMARRWATPVEYLIGIAGDVPRATPERGHQDPPCEESV